MHSYSDDNERIYAAIIVIGLMLIAAIIGLYWYGRNSTYDVTIRVNALVWERVQPVEMFKIVHQSTKRSQRPADAYNVRDWYKSSTCSRSVGSGKSKHTEYYECGSWWSDYDINRWVWDHDLVTSGTNHDEVVWPVFVPSGIGDVLGNTRAGERRAAYTVKFTCIDHTPIDYVVDDIALWRSYAEGSNWSVKINRLEQVYWDTLKRIAR